MLFESSMQRPFPADCSSLQKKSVSHNGGSSLTFWIAPSWLQSISHWFSCDVSMNNLPKYLWWWVFLVGFKCVSFPFSHSSGWFPKNLAVFPAFSAVLPLPEEDARVSWDSPRVMWLLDAERCRADVNFRWEVGQVGKNMSVIVRKCHLSGWGWLEHVLFVHILGIIIPTDFHIFQRGWNHQPVIYGTWNILGIHGMSHDP